MIFLIEYNRGEGRIVTFREFTEMERPEAERSRRDTELALNRRGVDHEVVLLEAEDKEKLRQTHRRYFGDFPLIRESANGEND